MAINKLKKLAAETLGLGSGGELAKLKLTPHDPRGKKIGDAVEALFNPNTINLARIVNWEQKRSASQDKKSIIVVEQDFRSVDAETLAIELFFDTYEPRSNSTSATLQRMATALTPTNPFQSPTGEDVREHTKKIAKLAKINIDLHQPPVCHLKWGTFDIFKGVLTNLDQRFTLFMADGTPVRATLSCTFAEFRTKAQYDDEMHSSDVTKTRTVRRNDTLHSLAAEEYNDPSLWRHIAKANGILNPREVKPGMVLTIPKLQVNG